MTSSTQRQPLLGIGSHNVCGLSSTKLTALLPLWDRLGLNILFIQEHHRRFHELPDSPQK